jgi:hypothetical protein
MALQLPLLQRGAQITEGATGLVSQKFQTWWQSVVTAIETQDGLQEETIAALQDVQDDIIMTQAALADTQSDLTDTVADLAATQADLAAAITDLQAVTTAFAISSSFIDPASVLTGEDAGSDARIVVANHRRQYGDGTGIDLTGATLTGLSYSTTYSVYYDNAARDDATPTFVATTLGGTARANYAVGRHFVGSVTTPASGGAPAPGDDYTPPGGGGGGTEIP